MNAAGWPQWGCIRRVFRGKKAEKNEQRNLTQNMILTRNVKGKEIRSQTFEFSKNRHKIIAKYKEWHPNLKKFKRALPIGLDIFFTK